MNEAEVLRDFLRWCSKYPEFPYGQVLWYIDQYKNRHTQPSDTEEVHVRIRDGRVTAMDGGPAPAAPSGATVVLHHDEEEEA